MPYSGNPATSDSDAVRFLLGDTNPQCPELLDAEIDFLLSTQGNSLNAAIFGAQALCAKFSGLVDTSAGRQRQANSQKARQYKALQAQLKESAAIVVFPINTGQDVAADEIDFKNRNLKQPNFSIGMTDNPRADRIDPVPEDRGGQP